MLLHRKRQTVVPAASSPAAPRLIVKEPFEAADGTMAFVDDFEKLAWYHYVPGVSFLYDVVDSPLDPLKFY